MKTYSITYDLGNPGRNYEGVSEQIKAVANGFCRPTKSQWIINSDASAAQIRDRISSKLDSGDKLLVNEVGNGWASWGLSNETNTWLHQFWRSACKVA